MSCANLPDYGRLSIGSAQHLFAQANERIAMPSKTGTTRPSGQSPIKGRLSGTAVGETRKSFAVPTLKAC